MTKQKDKTARQAQLNATFYHRPIICSRFAKISCNSQQYVNMIQEVKLELKLTIPKSVLQRMQDYKIHYQFAPDSVRLVKDKLIWWHRMFHSAVFLRS